MNLHERMKRYEAVSQSYLMRRTPVIIRLDGVAFHTFTKHFDKPFDMTFNDSMIYTAQYLVNTIQGCVLGYTQSDEISLVLQDYKKLGTDAWFGYNIQKITSVSAKMATAAFIGFFKHFSDKVNDTKHMIIYTAAIAENVGFDSRCFNLPFEEVNNYLIDRQHDATRNSINLLAQQYYSQKELEGINSKNLQNKLFTEHGINWSDLPYYQKRGSILLPNKYTPKDIKIETPIFSKDPDFVNSRIRFNDDDEKEEI